MGARREHRVVDIAAQAGLSRATVDRVLHGREGVRPETVAQVTRAIDELERQREQVHLSGRTLILDLVMQTPERFASASRDALEAELRSLRPAVLRARSHLSEHSDPAAAAALLDDAGPQAVARGDPQGAGPPAGRRGGPAAGRQGHPDRDVRDRRAAQPSGGVRRGWTTVAAGATAAYLDHTVGRTFRRSAGDREPLVVPWRGGARDRLPRTLAELAPRAQGPRGEGHRRPGPDDPGGRPRRVGAAPVDQRGLLRGRRERGHAHGVRGDRCDADGVRRARPRRRQPRTCCGRGRSPRSCTTTCGPTCGGRAGCCCRRAGSCPGKPATIPSQVQVVTPYNEPASIYGAAEL